MATPFLYHGQDVHWVVTRDETLELTLVSQSNATPRQIYVRCEPDNEQRLIPMEAGKQTAYLRYWHATIPLNRDKATTVYCFKWVTETEQFWLSGVGISHRMPGLEQQFRYNAQAQPPQWVQSQVFYQIFPDRFANGNPSISVKSDEYCLNGREMPTVAKTWGAPVSTHNGTGASEFYGGDLQGITNKLDYLQALGVTTLYLNPIFTSPSNHKYDTTDYFTVDPHLGTNAEFAQLSRDVHQRGMKIVLDAVFNHTSHNHPWFDRFSQREDGLGAWHNSDSPYRDYYQFLGQPTGGREQGNDNYIGWNGIDTLPKLNFLNSEVRDYFYAGDQNVIAHWLGKPYDIDGWRFDVIHMLGEGEGAANNAHYVKAFRAAAKAANPESYVLGEHFFEATQWLQGDQEDGAMNYYGFAHPLRAFLAGLDIAFDPIALDASEFAAWLNEATAKVPWRNQLAQLNQLDSHDTMRFLTMVNGDEARLKMALTFLFAWVGVPCLYYGTEVALEGGHDPDNRRCFPWERLATRKDMIELVQTLAHLRTHSVALQQGSVQWLHHQGDVLAFARTYGEQSYLCVLNRSFEAQTVTLPLWQLTVPVQSAKGILSHEQWCCRDGEMTLSIPAQHCEIFLLS
ncbi:maltodextrin glucosidase [Vibrio sp. SM6]|uniref:Maltodextrin glucosidase n=1 Tax=Vibrio agarilyticus TaxID=2726741 RepID=A0A7X8TNK1_9VIBR|nr:maltodextrin glucosidase [Vibrio agarilyticus]NLS11835.1 maltodextrin glucosidase [Vibrio agarilyticus]